MLQLFKHLAGKHNQSKHAGGRVKISHYDYDSDEGDPYDIAKRAGIYVSNDKEPILTATEGGKLVGAAFVSVDHASGEYSFDIAVDPDYQGRKIGTKLLDGVMEDYQSNAWEFPDMKIQVDAINPIMVKMLAKRGFEEVGSTMSGVQMVYGEDY